MHPIPEGLPLAACAADSHGEALLQAEDGGEDDGLGAKELGQHGLKGHKDNKEEEGWRDCDE